jgi:hypothetical protein
MPVSLHKTKVTGLQQQLHLKERKKIDQKLINLRNSDNLIPPQLKEKMEFHHI